MVKIFVNSEKIEYYPIDTITIEPGRVHIRNCSGMPVLTYDIFVVSLTDGLARRDVRSICSELERKDGTPTLYCEVNDKTIGKNVSSIEEIKEEDMHNVLNNKEPDLKLDIDFSESNPLQEYFVANNNQIGCLSGEDALVSAIENFRDITWKDYVDTLANRSKEKLSNATSYDEAINYLASELSTMKSMVNEFLNSLEEKL